MSTRVRLDFGCLPQGCLHTLTLTRQQAGLFTHIITDQATSWKDLDG